MRFVTVRRSTEQTTIVNVDQVTYLSHDIYGTKIFFVSGDHIVCPDDIDALSERLFGSIEPERCPSSEHLAQSGARISGALASSGG